MIIPLLAFAQDNTFHMDDNSLVTVQTGGLIHVEGDFQMDSNSDLDNAGNIQLQGNWHFLNATVDVTTVAGADEQGTVLFQNNYPGNTHNIGSIQTIFAPSDMLGNAAFYNIILNNDQTIVDLSGGAIEVKNTLDFSTTNILRTETGITTGDGEDDYAHFVYMSNTSNAAFLNGASASGNTGGYIEGRLRWNLSNGTTYTFLVGTDAKNSQLFDLLPTSSANTIVEGSFTEDAGGPISLVDCISVDLDCVPNHGWWNIDPIGTNNITNYAVRLKGSLTDNCGGVDYGVVKKPEETAISSYALEGDDGFIPAEKCDGVATTVTSVARHNLTAFSDFSIGTALIPLLPVELLSFSGEEKGVINQLHWTIASEQNVSHYEMERRTDNTEFSYLGTVDAIGNIASEWTYSFDDIQPELISYYRLKMVDMDGSYEYSNIVTIERSKKGAFISSIFPVPAKNQINIQINSTQNTDIYFEIIDVLGRVLLRKNDAIQNGMNLITLDIQQFVSGYYYIRINGDNNDIKRFLIQR